MYEIRPEQPEDAPLVEALYDRVFGPGRERKVSYRYREGIPPVRELCAVSVVEGTPVAAVRFWPVRLDGMPALLLGPLAVEPELQGRGIGRMLVADRLVHARALGFRLVFLVGDPAYYARFGFRPVPEGIVMPGEDPKRLQWRILRPGPLPRHGEILRADGTSILPAPAPRAAGRTADAAAP